MIIPFNVSWFRATWNLIQGQLGPGLTCCQQLKVFHTNFANFAKTLEFDICTFNLKISCCHLFIIWRVCVWEGICTNMYLQLYTGNGNSTLGSFALLQCCVVNEIYTICDSWMKNECKILQKMPDPTIIAVIAPQSAVKRHRKWKRDKIPNLVLKSLPHYWPVMEI